MTTASRDETNLRIGFKRHLRAHVVRGEAVYLLSERGARSIVGDNVEALAPLLDGSRDLAGLCRDLPPGLAAAEAGAIVVRLVDEGLVSLREPPGNGEHAAAALAYWEAAGLAPDDAARRVTDTRVRVIALDDDAMTSTMTDALRAAGLTDTDTEARLSVVLCEDYLDPRLAEVDAAQRAANQPWLLAKPGGTQVWIGPLFDPAGDTACWHCLAHRLRAHRQAETRLRAVSAHLTPPAVSLPPLGAAAVHLVALEAARGAAGLATTTRSAVWTLDSFDLTGRHHDVRRRPQCHCCGDDGLMARLAGRPVTLVSRPKASRGGGGHRAAPPEQVLADYGHLVSPVTGVLKEITRDERGPAAFNAFRAGPNLAIGARRDVDQLRLARGENGGKGITPLHAQVSALCEAVERHSAHFHGDESTLTATYAELGERAVHPNDCLLYDERQFAGRAAWNAAHSAFQHVGDPFDEHAQTSWTPVWSLTGGTHRLLPTGMLYFDVPGRHAGGAFAADSNGNAAGASLEDALLQGLLELVERDAVALWWYNRTSAPGVDLGSFRDRWIDDLREVHAGLHRDVWVLDVTSDAGIPVMAALSRRTDAAREDIMLGFGAHLDPHVALVRALTELNQLMPAVVGAGENGEYGWSDPDAVRWWRTATWAGMPYLRPDPAVPARTPTDYDPSTVGSNDLRDDVTAVRHRLEGLGLEVMVLDQTRPDLGLPVVKAIVPGMRGFWARYAPGRLFDVPVRLGRLPRPTPYDRLNPIPLFL